MKRNSRLSLALHTLGHMAREPGQLQTSADIADHAGTNPVVVRRVLGKLRDAGLLVATKGKAGGWRLARPAGAITLADVYRALDERLLAGGEPNELPACSVEQALHQKVFTVLEEIERVLIERLQSTTIAEVCESRESRRH